jgi:hypothetical protein
MTHTASPGGLQENPAAAGGRNRWPLIGTAAGVIGLAATLLCDIHVDPVADNDRISAADVPEISRVTAHVGGVAGYITVALLLVLAAQWRRRVEPRVPGSTAAHVVSNGLIASAGALSLGYGWKLALGGYLPGGLDEESGFDQAGLYVYYVLNDFGSFIGWLGVLVAAGAVAWMALRERTVARWIGVVSVILVTLPVAGILVASVPGLPAMGGIPWMIVTFTGLAFGKGSTITR